MELEKVTAEIRPRSEWEAVDLGLSLARVHFGTLWKAWLVTVIPVCAVILAAFYQSPGWGVFLIWWLKPIWDRVALFPLSRNLFGEEPKTKETMRVVPQQLCENWLMVILGIGFAVCGVLLHPDGNGWLITGYWLCFIGCLFYRSSLYRSLVLPVHFLEGLRKDRYRARTDLLTRRSSGTGLALTMICLLMEVGVFISLFYFVELMVPPGAEWSMGRVFAEFFEVGPESLPRWLVMMVAGAYVVSMSVTSWFYAGGGFGLYVNSRTRTEGWDIELAFKRLGQRLSLVLIGVGLFFIAPDVRADSAKGQMREVLKDEVFEEQNRTQRTEVREQMDEVLKDDDFDEKSRTRRSDQSEGEDGLTLNGGAGIFAGVGQVIFWGVAIFVIVGVVWLIVHNSQAFSGGAPLAEGKRKKVRTLAGMNIAPEALPDDVHAVAQRLWSEGRKREALALLYRGAISLIIMRELVEIDESDTEMDCLRRLKLNGVNESTYFEKLTQFWIGVAYAGQAPSESEMIEIWSGWPFSNQGERGRS